MCMEDVIIGRSTKPRETSVLLGVTTGAFIPGNPNRVGLVISAPVTNPLFLTLSANTPAGQGMRLSTSQAPLKLDILDDGNLVTSAIFASQPVAGETITFWETLLDFVPAEVLPPVLGQYGK